MAQEGEKSSKVVHLRVSHREAGRCANTCRVQTFYSVTNQRSYGNARIRFTEEQPQKGKTSVILNQNYD